MPKSSAQTLVPQPHGGALTRSHGGAKPGAGRPPSYIREVARQAFAERIPILARIADSDEERSQDRIAAIKALGEAGGVDKLALTADELPEQVLTPERAAQAWAALEMVRSVREIERLLTGEASHEIESR